VEKESTGKERLVKSSGMKQDLDEVPPNITPLAGPVQAWPSHSAGPRTRKAVCSGHQDYQQVSDSLCWKSRWVSGEPPGKVNLGIVLKIRMLDMNFKVV